jgi:hypothetical protein
MRDKDEHPVFLYDCQLLFWLQIKMFSGWLWNYHLIFARNGRLYLIPLIVDRYDYGKIFLFDCQAIDLHLLMSPYGLSYPKKISGSFRLL